jgi:hypothetical protein
MVFWRPTAYNPELNLLHIRSIEGCNIIGTVQGQHGAALGP